MTHPDDSAPELEPAGPDWLDDAEHPEPPEPPRVRVQPLIDGDDPRPEIRMSHELHEVVEEAVAALAGCRVNGRTEAHGIGDPRMFQRAHELVSVARYVPPPDRADFIARGQPIIYPIAAPTLVDRLSRYARFYRRAKPTAQEKAGVAHGVPIPERWDRIAGAPPNIVAMVLDRKEWPGIRPLVGVSETPMLRPDGTIARPGKDRAEYDWATGYLLVPGLDVPEIPEEPTQKQARAALKVLAEPFADFPYVDRAHRAVPIAAILTVLARAAIRGAVPGFVFDAATRGSGKTKQCDVVSLVGLGRYAARATFPVNDEELEKVLGAYAISGAQIILFDNVTRALGGGPIDKVLTAEDTVDLRVLGRSENRTLVWRAITLFSGNNITLGEDTMRRVLVARLESPLESPEKRDDFKHPDLLGYVRAHRAELVAAALTVLRAYFAVGCPPTDCEKDAGFAAWSRLVPHAIRYAGGPDVMACKPKAAAAMTDDMRALVCILEMLPKLDPAQKGLSSRDIIRALYPPHQSDEERSADGFDDLRDAIETLAVTRHSSRPDSKLLGKKLQRYRSRVLDGRRLAVLEEDPKRGNRYGVVKA